MICPVRNATPEEKEKLQNSIAKYEKQGFHVHYPERDTNQSPFINGVNTGGYSICLENATAIANAKTVAIYYNKASTGSMFDLGVTTYFQEKDPSRKFILENNFEYEDENIIDKVVLKLSKENASEAVAEKLER